MMTDLSNMKPMLAEYAELKTQMKAMTVRIKELDAQVRPVLTDQGTVNVGAYCFTVTLMPGRKTLDKKSLEAAGIDLEVHYKTGAPFTKLDMKTNEEVD